MDKPRYLSQETLKAFLEKVYEYMNDRSLNSFSIILHGGEPMLWELESLRFLIKELNYHNTGDKKIELSMQTNAFQINWEIVKIFHENGYRFGISIDGPKEQHDKFRVTHSNKPSYDKIMMNIGEIMNRGFGDTIGGFLIVSDPTINPGIFFDWLLKLPIPKVSVLWPIEFNYNNKPWTKFGKAEDDYAVSPIFGKWFYDLFKIWWEHDDPNFFIRHFYDVLFVLLGHGKHGDSLVNDQLNMFVINTDGDIEYHDYFRAYKNNSCYTGLNINSSNLFDIEKEAEFNKLLHLKDYLPNECTGCIHKKICGGGFLPGRIDNAISDYAIHKSVLCYDHLYFFDNIKKLIGKVA